MSIEVPPGWAYVEEGKKPMVGPKGSPFVSMAYVGLELHGLPHPADQSTAAEFIHKNLKLAKTETLPGGRVLGHAVQPDGAVEHHQWNIVAAVDATHIALVLLSMDTGVDHAKIVAVVDQIARSVQFIPATPRPNQSLEPSADRRLKKSMVDS